MLRIVIIVLAVLIVAGMILEIEDRQERVWIDAVSASTKSERMYRDGEASTVITDSPFAERYRALGLSWEPQWHNVAATSITVAGRRTNLGHGRAPEIHSFRSADLQQLFLAGASDDEVRAFFQVMSTGTEAEQRAAIEAAADKIFSKPTTTRASE